MVKNKLIHTFFRKHKKLLLKLVIIISIGIGVGSINPYIYGLVIDSITNKDMSLLSNNILLYFGISLAVVLLGTLETYIGKIVSIKIESDVKRYLFNQIIYMKKSSLDNYSVGELMSRIENDAAGIVGYHLELLTSSISIIFNLVISVWFLFHISIKIAVVAIILLPSTYIINWLFKSRIREIEFKQKKYLDTYFHKLNEVFFNLSNVKVFCKEKKNIEEYGLLIDEGIDLSEKNIRLSLGIEFFRSNINNISEIILLFLISVSILRGKMSIGSMVAFTTYLGRLFDAISQILTINIDRQGYLVNCVRVQEIEKEPKEEIKVGSRENIAPISSIRLDHIRFRYNEEYVLNEINLKIKENGIYSIVGENGCGKSTLLKIMVGLYSCEEGGIFLNDVDFTNYSLQDIRNHISFMTKEPYLLNDTFINNMKIGDESITNDKIIELYRIVGLSDYIEGLPLKYEEAIGEGGKYLSSGQRQRLGIARIILRNTDVILLDEATSDLDIKTQKDILKIMKILSKEKIIICVSHDEKWTKNSDWIFVLKEGRVFEQGRHLELIEKNDYYASLFQNKKS